MPERPWRHSPRKASGDFGLLRGRISEVSASTSRPVSASGSSASSRLRSRSSRGPIILTDGNGRGQSRENPLEEFAIRVEDGFQPQELIRREPARVAHLGGVKIKLLAYGESPYGCLMTRRIERAMALLRRGDLSFTEVCFLGRLLVAGHLQQSLHRAAPSMAAMDTTINASFLPHEMRWITVGPADQPGTSILLAPPAADPGITQDERRTSSR
jgi:hypothetical protein